MPQPLRIVGLQVENFKKIKAVSIVPKGDLVQISGRNGSGKTSCLDAIWAVLGGKDQIPGVPIRTGEDQCKIRLDLGELIVSRSIKEGGTTLKVESADGAVYKSPQTMLDAIMGTLTFDPLAFTRLAPKAQADQLRKVAEIGIDIDLIDAQNKQDFEARTGVNRDAKAAHAAADAIQISNAIERKDLSPFMDRIQAIGETARVRNQEDARRTGLETELTKQHDRMNRLRTEIENVTAWISDTEKHLAALSPLPEIEDPSAIREEMEAAEAHNRIAQQAESDTKRREEHLARAKELDKKAEALTKAIDDRTKAKDDALKAAALPVPGLGFKDGVVIYNGVPFDQASAAEQLRISTAIAMAGNPRLKVIRITDGSLLDDDSMAMLEAMAHEHGYQVWIELVDATGKVGIYIEDGAVKADNQVED